MSEIINFEIKIINYGISYRCILTGMTKMPYTIIAAKVV